MPSFLRLYCICKYIKIVADQRDNNDVMDCYAYTLQDVNIYGTEFSDLAQIGQTHELKF